MNNNKSGEVKICGFDPAALGIEEYIPRSGRVSKKKDSDYLILADSGRSDNKKNLRLCLSAKSREFVIGMFGDCVNVGVNKEGQIFIWPGNRTKVSINGGQKGKSGANPRGSISIASWQDKFTDLFNGEFRHAYVKMAPYSNGDALVFTPTGEVDYE